MTMISTETLLQRVGDKDRVAFKQLYEAAAPILFGIGMKMMRDRGSAQEVTQEAFVRIWRKADLFDAQKGSAMAWMTTITRRIALDRLRQASAPTVPLDAIDEQGLERASQGPGDHAIAADLRRCLGELEINYSRSVVLAYVYGLTHAELARTLKRPVGTIKSWVRRGLAQLNKCLDDDN